MHSSLNPGTIDIEIDEDRTPLCLEPKSKKFPEMKRSGDFNEVFSISNNGHS